MSLFFQPVPTATGRRKRVCLNESSAKHTFTDLNSYKCKILIQKSVSTNFGIRIDSLKILCFQRSFLGNNFPFVE